METSMKKKSIAIVNVIVKILNFFLLLTRPRAFFHFRWGSSFKDAFQYINQYAPYQFTAIYGRYSAKYKFHPLQQHEQKIRKFDLVDSLAGQVRHLGNRAFYDAILSPSFIHRESAMPSQSNEADLTKLEDVSTPSTSADLVYQHVYSICNGEKDRTALAKLARATYLAGFSRPVDAFNLKDWDNLRSELRAGTHDAPALEDTPGQRILPVALSYKGNKSEITRRMRFLHKNHESPAGDRTEREITVLTSDHESISRMRLEHENHEPPADERTEREIRVLTEDVVEDFRWSQVIRTCKALARRKDVRYVRLWVDRLMGMGLSEHDNAARNRLLDWEEYGLLAYAVCPVVRVYQQEEKQFGTDFWRKLETVLGVAGSGLMVDDYILRKYDKDMYFGRHMYQRLDHGVSLIGGGSQYLRSVTLALATAIMTDGISVSAVNEDVRTKEAVAGWKAWALRTIAEGAYSTKHSYMMKQEPRFAVGEREFMILAFWESLVADCEHLKGQSYLDMSYQRSKLWRKSSCWDGIVEWIGMIPTSCLIQDKDRKTITSFLNDNVKMEVWTAPTGHVAAWLQMKMDEGKFQRSLVVVLARFSSTSEGHVTAVAEATGLRGKSLMPW